MIQISVKSCQRDRMEGRHRQIRETWGNKLPDGVSLKFFVGDGWTTPDALHQDEIALECPDDYDSLPFKTREICRWSRDTTNPDYLFLCDTDTYVDTKRMLESGFEQYAYYGYFANFTEEPFPYFAISRNGIVEDHPACHRWASGGFGYFLNRQAIQFVASEEPTSWAEDLWVGQVMAKYGFNTGNTRGKLFTKHPWKP
jgi:hypothetical protein